MVLEEDFWQIDVNIGTDKGNRLYEDFKDDFDRSREILLRDPRVCVSKLSNGIDVLHVPHPLFSDDVGSIDKKFKSDGFVLLDFSKLKDDFKRDFLAKYPLTADECFPLRKESRFKRFINYLKRLFSNE